MPCFWGFKFNSLKKINEQTKRNIDRFPEKFMFQLNENEFEIFKSQVATSSWGGTRKLPFVFTEHGILQLSNIIKSESAIRMSIKIIEIFVNLRQFLNDNLSIKLEIEEVKKKSINQDKNIELVFSCLE